MAEQRVLLQAQAASARHIISDGGVSMTSKHLSRDFIEIVSDTVFTSARPVSLPAVAHG